MDTHSSIARRLSYFMEHAIRISGGLGASPFELKTHAWIWTFALRPDASEIAADVRVRQPVVHRTSIDCLATAKHRKSAFRDWHQNCQGSLQPRRVTMRRFPLENNRLFALLTATLTCTVPLLSGCGSAPEETSIAETSSALTVADCPAGSNIIVGTTGNDIIDGTNGNDCILGLGGNDVLRGHNGDDVLLGGDGNDVLEGGNGKDTLYGEDGDDQLLGGTGKEVRGHIIKKVAIPEPPPAPPAPATPAAPAPAIVPDPAKTES